MYHSLDYIMHYIMYYDSILSQYTAQLHSLVPRRFSLSGGKIRLVIRLFRFGAGAPECWRIVLF